MKRGRRTVTTQASPCRGKRRYRSQGDALEAAMLAGVERLRSAYQCPWCGFWHLTSVRDV